MADELSRSLLAYGFKLGPGSISRKPHFAVLDPVINEISKNLEFSSNDAKIDRSEGSGELEYFDPGAVDRFVKMPERLERLAEHLENQDKILEGFSKNIELHQAVLCEIRDAIRELKGSLK
jgi:uncharacterized coiled-coil protein SlyX